MGVNKSVFISHSSKDFLLADRILQIFENRELFCWIAPRDIPYGSEWAGAIAQAITQAKVMLFIFTSNSNASTQVVREINLALQNNLLVIPIRFDGDEVNPSLHYYLSTVQWLTLDREHVVEEALSLCDKIKSFVENGSDSLVGSAMADHGFGIDVDINLDDQLDAMFDELTQNPEQQVQPVSPFRKKMLDRVCQRVLESTHMERNGDYYERPETCDRDDVSDRFFSLREENATIKVFLVRKEIDPRTLTQQFAVEELPCSREVHEDGSSYASFDLNRVDREGNPLIELIFPKGQQMTLINMGFVDDAVSLSNKPMVKEWTLLSNEDMDTAAKRYPVNAHGRNIIIDPECCQTMQRKKYYDKQNQKWIHYIEVVPYKRYFSFRVQADGISQARKIDIAYGYYKGRYGLQRNILEAAQWFEETDTPEAHYYLGRIFTEDPLLKDPDDARYYLEKALAGGELRAQTYLS